ncbi:MAG: glutaredoxin 3 [Pseudomonadota bacterium]
MKPVEIYTSPICGFCVRAKRLLDSKGVSYVEHDIFSEPGARAEMIQRSHGGRTVPQIFIDGAPIGGCDELHALERAGKLDAMLAA